MGILHTREPKFAASTAAITESGGTTPLPFITPLEVPSAMADIQPCLNMASASLQMDVIICIIAWQANIHRYS
jgi:hypothetical protein